MMVFFLFTMGLCALSQAVKAHALQLTDLLPTEEMVQIMHFSNGVKSYVQEHDTPAHCGSFRVVFRKTPSEEELYHYDGAIESWDLIEQFFNYCKKGFSVNPIESLPSLENVTHSDLPTLGAFRPQEIAVVAVGDFPIKEMESLIERHFASLDLSQETFSLADPIQIGTDPNMPKVALHLSYPIGTQSIQTYLDLKEVWKMILLQDLFQQRLERCSRGLEKVWVHPHPRFFYPINGYSLVSHEDCENLLTFFLCQVEAIRNDGFCEDEFYAVKHTLLNQLQCLASRSVSPDSSFLASYFADQFLMGDRCLSLQSFMNASVEFIEEIKMQDLFPHIDSFLCEKKRLIQIAYPISARGELLTKNQVEQMIERVASLASFYRDSEIPKKEIWASKAQRGASMPVGIDQATEKGSSLIKLANNNATDPEGPYYQLPLTEKEKRVIHTLITTIAEKNILQLVFIKHSVEKKGKKVEHVHPLRFMGYILSSSELRSCVRKIRKSSFKWDAFVSGFARRMKEEHANDNLYIHLPGFCSQTGGNLEIVTNLVRENDWEGLIEEYL